VQIGAGVREALTAAWYAADCPDVLLIPEEEI
jgi:hypothetical protein